jgi:hypothetical protein
MLHDKQHTPLASLLLFRMQVLGSNEAATTLALDSQRCVVDELLFIHCCESYFFRCIPWSFLMLISKPHPVLWLFRCLSLARVSKSVHAFFSSSSSILNYFKHKE